MARPRKARLEGAVALTVPAASEDLGSLVAAFRELYPDEWNAIALCPLQHGLDVMIERLK